MDGLIPAALPVAVSSLLLSSSVLEGKEDEHVVSMPCLIVLFDKQQAKKSGEMVSSLMVRAFFNVKTTTATEPWVVYARPSKTRCERRVFFPTSPLPAK